MTSILIYGAGANGQKVFTRVNADNAAVIGFVDRNAQDGLLHGKPVYLPEAICALAYDYLVISNLKYKPLRHELENLWKVSPEKILCYYEYPFQPERLKDIFYIDSVRADVLERELYKKESELMNAPYEYAEQVLAQKLRIPVVKTPEETIDEIVTHHRSICRLGDGELATARGILGCGFQNLNEVLQERLQEILKTDRTDILVGLHDGFGSLERYAEEYRQHLREQLKSLLAREVIYPLLDLDKTYYNTYFTRPWSTTHDEAYAENIFHAIRKIWEGRKVVFIEGAQTRLGIGNDLFCNTAQIERLLCPPCDAFDAYENILEAARRIDKDKLLLLALGPTATVLAYDLSAEGYQAVDIGHLDVEYEWFRQRCHTKKPVRYKYVNEALGGANVEDYKEEGYRAQVIMQVES